MPESQDAARHLSARWLGALLFAIGACGLLAAIVQYAQGQGRLGNIMVYVAATGFSLGTFGIHNDTGLALLVRAQGALPDAQGEELQAEQARDRAALNALIPTPRMSWGVTVLALGIQALAMFRLLRDWGVVGSTG